MASDVTGASENDPVGLATVAYTAPGDGSESMPPIGIRLGRYVVIDVLGMGGMGVVYSAFDPHLDRKVAVKVLRQSVGASSERDRLQREAKAMALLTHPNVVGVYDVGDDNGQFFIAMEFVRGVSLRRWLATARPWRDVVAVFVQAGRGLAAAHAAGLVHRDFKPDNVLLSEGGEAKVADFGLARAGESVSSDSALLAEADTLRRTSAVLTRAGVLVGTPAYMSPEQYVGLPAETRSDQFSFCVALYEALYGELPFEGTTLAMLAAHVTSGRRRPVPTASDVPGWIAEAVGRGLQPNADDRWPSMDELLRVLGRDPDAERRRSLQRATAAVVTVCVAIAAIVGWQWRRSVVHAEFTACRSGFEGGFDAEFGLARRQMIRSALLATRDPLAERTALRVDEALARFASDWQRVHEVTCRDAIVYRAISSDMVDLRERCLDRQRRQAGAVVELLLVADSTLMAHLDDLVGRLPGPEACWTLVLLMDYWREDLHEPRHAQMVVELSAARAELDVARYAAARDRMVPLVEQLKETKDRHLRAEVLSLAATAEEGLGNPQRARELRLRGLADALASGASRQAAGLANQLMNDALTVRGRVDEARTWSFVAEGLVSRSDDFDARLVNSQLEVVLAVESGESERALQVIDDAIRLAEASKLPDHRLEVLRGLRATVLGVLGRHAEAFEVYDVSRVRLRAAYGGDSWYEAAVLANIGLMHENMGNLTAARQFFRDSVEMKERLRGETPGLALGLNNLASVEVELGALDDASVHYSRARSSLARSPDSQVLPLVDQGFGEIARLRGQLADAQVLCGRSAAAIEAARGVTHPHLVAALRCLGEVAAARGAFAEALPILERAWAIARDDARVTQADRGKVSFARARALVATGESEAAREAANEAISAFEQAGVWYRSRIDEVRAWMRSAGP